MKMSDYNLRQRLRKGAPVPPRTLSDTFEYTLDNLAPVKKVKRRRPVVMAARICACLLLFLFFMLPNVSPAIAYAMRDIPIVGDIVQVITVRKEFFSNEYHYKNVEIPHVSGSGELQGAIDLINDDLDALTNAVLEEFEKEFETFPEAHTGLDITYETVQDTDTWFTLKLSILRTAGSGVVEEYFYHIDKRQKKIVSLSDLFESEFDYIGVFTQEVLRQAKARAEQDNSQIYWVYPDEETYFGFTAIKPDQNFYFTESGDIVLVFDKYEIAPGYMGTPEFTIPAKLFETHLNS